jgi:glycerol kinase
MSYILALDQGTTSSRSIIFDHSGSVIAAGQKEYTQIYPASGWVEHDPFEIWNSQIETAIEALSAAGVTARDISGVGITNQRETTIIWDRQTGEPIHNAIVWQDRRTSENCDRVRASHGDIIRAKTGLETDAYFSASKIKWLLDNIDSVREKAEAGDLAFGTVDTWLVSQLTGGRRHITDVSNASRTMLFDINTLEWDSELLSIFDIPRAILPEVLSSSEIYGEIVHPEELRGIPIAGIAGDQQAALFGQACFDRGSTKNTYGTGCFMLQNVGTRPAHSKNRLLSTVAWQIEGETEYALEGSVFIGGAVVGWLRDALGIIQTSGDIEDLAASVPDNGGVYFVPALAGLGAPYWDQSARGTIIGLTRGTGKAHIARELRVDGGATCNEALLQFQADILQIPVVRSRTTETTALGAAYLAGLATGFWKSNSELKEHWKSDRKFDPQITPAAAESAMDRWREAVDRSLNWAK